MEKNDSARGNEILYPVQNDEILYRSVRGEEGKEYTTKSNGKPDFNREAFKAENRKPSVDRAKLRDHPSFFPNLTITTLLLLSSLGCADNPTEPELTECQSIAAGKLPVKFDSPLELDERQKQ